MDKIDSVGSYINVEGLDFYFTGCQTCDKRCCDGKMGYAITPLVVDDFAEVYKNFPILFATVNDVFRPVMLLNDGNSKCSYLDENGMCSIYDQRPPSCKLYPVSPLFDQVLIDSNCPSVSGEIVGKEIIKEGKVTNEFYHQRLEDFPQKLQKTSDVMKNLVADKDAFEVIGEVSGVILFKYVGEKENEYVTMHHNSLLHLE